MTDPDDRPARRRRSPTPAPPPGPGEPVPTHAETGGPGDPVEIVPAAPAASGRPPRNRYHGDDSLMNRFDRHGLRRYRARDGIIAVLVSCALMVVFAGASVKHTGQQLQSKVGRNVVLAFGDPAASIAQRPAAQRDRQRGDRAGSRPTRTSAARAATFSTIAQTSAAGGIPPVTPDAFDPAKLGLAAPPRRPLHTLLVTGDSMSEPLDSDLAQALDPKGVHVIQDPHIGTGISQTILLDWGKEAAAQVRQDHPDAVVIFIGANDGFSMPGPGGAQVDCCTAQWAAIYAQRARSMMDIYRQNGVARVYWLTLPGLPRRRPLEDRAGRRLRGHRRRPAVGRPGPHDRHGARLHARLRLPRRDDRSAARRRSSARPTASTSTTPAPSSPATIVETAIAKDFTTG